MLDVDLVIQRELDMEYQKDEMSGKIFGTTVGYLLGFTEVTYARISEVLNDCIFYGLALGWCVGQIFRPVLGIIYRPLLG